VFSESKAASRSKIGNDFEFHFPTTAGCTAGGWETGRVSEFGFFGVFGSRLLFAADAASVSTVNWLVGRGGLGSAIRFEELVKIGEFEMDGAPLLSTQFDVSKVSKTIDAFFSSQVVALD